MNNTTPGNINPAAIATGLRHAFRKLLKIASGSIHKKIGYPNAAPPTVITSNHLPTGGHRRQAAARRGESNSCKKPVGHAYRQNHRGQIAASTSTGTPTNVTALAVFTASRPPNATYGLNDGNHTDIMGESPSAVATANDNQRPICRSRDLNFAPDSMMADNLARPRRKSNGLRHQPRYAPCSFNSFWTLAISTSRGRQLLCAATAAAAPAA